MAFACFPQAVLLPKTVRCIPKKDTLLCTENCCNGCEYDRVVYK